LNFDDIKKQITANGLQFKENNKYSFVSGLCFYSDLLVIKKINVEKVRNLYNGNYCDFVMKYYNKIKEIIPTVPLHDSFYLDNSIYEIQELVLDSKLLESGSLFEWEEILKLYNKILKYIDDITYYNIIGNVKVGLDTSIWNFTIDGRNFDFSPPRMILENGSSMFTRLNDQEHYRRTYYRNFDSEGMKLNLTVTLFNAILNNKILINNININWKEEIVSILAENVSGDMKYQITSKNLEETYEFRKHPLKLLKEMI